MMRTRSFLLVVVSVLALAFVAASCNGATPAPTTKPTTVDPYAIPPGVATTAAKRAVAPRAETIDASLKTADGRTRTYHLYVPTTVEAGATGVRVPLLVALHGGLGSGTQFERTTGFDGLAQANRFVVVYPDGIGIGANGSAVRTWNGGDCCGPAEKQDVDDVSFIHQLIDTIEARYPIDHHRVFAAGHSNGGIMAYRLACQLSGQIVAIGVQSTSLEFTPCHPTDPVSVLHIHGTADQNIPINGGNGSDAVTTTDFNPPLDGVKALAAADHCPAARTVVRDPSNPDLTVNRWHPCADHTEVVFITVAGAPHAWMGPGNQSARQGAAYQELDSSFVIWTFLANHPRP